VAQPVYRSQDPAHQRRFEGEIKVWVSLATQLELHETLGFGRPRRSGGQLLRPRRERHGPPMSLRSPVELEVLLVRGQGR